MLIHRQQQSQRFMHTKKLASEQRRWNILWKGTDEWLKIRLLLKSTDVISFGTRQVAWMKGHLSLFGRAVGVHHSKKTRLGSVWTGQHGLHENSVNAFSFFCSRNCIHPDRATFSARRTFSLCPRFLRFPAGPGFLPRRQPSTLLPKACLQHSMTARTMSYMR